MSLKGKSAIVTGGNTGIGKAIVLALAEEGANVCIDYVAQPEATEELERRSRRSATRRSASTPTSARSPTCRG